ncbi:MAG: glycosyltransferase [Cyanobacteria bacterium P01_H01_bin.152]
MNILFLDQSGKLGGAELSLLDVAVHHRDRALVGLFQDGLFRTQLQARQVPVQVLTREILQVRKDSNLLQALQSIGQVIPLINHVTHLSRDYDVIYTNTPKAFIVGALASYRSGCPLVYHLRDIISADHFSRLNRTLLITLANARCRLVIANSNATRQAFVQAGGRPEIVQVAYNGFNPEVYQASEADCQQIRQRLDVGDRFVVGHFSRLSPWKGQHILIEALSHCPENVVALLVGDALFGEDDYVAQLHQQVQALNLQQRVHFLGFRTDIPALMHACDLIAHTSTAPEPFGRVIIEGMLCQRPVVAAAAGGAVELIDHGHTGWLTPPGEAHKLADVITNACQQPERSRAIALAAQQHAQTHFNLAATNGQISALLHQI